ncbi:hypothetical protein PFICI_06628 [Pestalotiopsis fici W106-1]|uniref:Ubiquitin 3 binding protein But2 C-terminal domain-containing protein n=1 Tax=Pestalotiopsis fici (strain W106-1 / CGMCC3.15140) TaxID=1229662 RepID=W3X8X3_PESFW|nr:uncharacterized protein PFICI_06628 [Pestalotiopsis fici W106-1]ETS81626.1 hypothetical protein PFICI_06628 [Pestalotiopsis fici W106-1]
MRLDFILANALTATATAAAMVSSGKQRRSCYERAPSVIQMDLNVTIVFSPVLYFDVPRGELRGPCTLVAKFPAGYPISSSGDDLVNVVAASGEHDGAVVGVLRFVSAPNVPTVTVVGTFECDGVMDYQLEIADSATEANWVSFEQDEDAGLFLEIGDRCRPESEEEL